MNSILSAPFIQEIQTTAANMYRSGWNERNGGNISIRLNESQLEPYLPDLHPLRKLPLSIPFPELSGCYFLVTGTGKYLKNVSADPETNLGLIRIAADGTYADLLWGYRDGGTFTSEIIMHLSAHQIRSHTEPTQRVVMHAHPTNLIAMTHTHSLDEREFTRTLWGMMTECIVIFPEGVGVLDWMISSSDRIGLASAEKFRDYRVLVWAMHGLTATGSTLDEAFGLIETVEKAAQIYMLTVGKSQRAIDFKMLRGVADSFHLNVNPEWLD